MDNTCFTQYYEKYDEFRFMRRIGFLLTLYYARRFEIVTPNLRTAAKGSGMVFRQSAEPTVKTYKMLSTYSARNVHNVDGEKMNITKKGIRSVTFKNEYITAVCLDSKAEGKISRIRNIENFSINYIRQLSDVTKFAGRSALKYCNVAKT